MSGSLVAGACAFLAVWAGIGSSSARRFAAVSTRPDRVGPVDPVDLVGSPRLSPVEDVRLRTLACVAGLAGLGFFMAGGAGALLGLPAGLLASWWVGRLEAPSVVRAREEAARELPLAVDLLAACAAVGRPPDQALVLVARALGGPLAARLDGMTARLSLGADPVAEWRRLADDEVFGPLGRTMVRSLDSGAPLVDGLSRLADDRRRERRTAGQLKARSVGVKAAGPLALCFLPAFMLVGVIPTVVGAFTNLAL